MKGIITKDGSITLYSRKYDETYHSVSGAAEESLKKFVEPCKIRELAEKGEVKILDIGFGLGYNIIIALNQALGKNKDCKIMIYTLEKDILIFSEILKLKVKIKNYDIVRDIAGRVLNAIKKINHNFANEKITYQKNNIKITLLFGDAENSIKRIKTKFNAVFLDPFSPPKNPELWTISFLKDIKKLLEKNAILATYSCARTVRENLRKAGFIIKDGPVVGRKSPGTLGVAAD